MVMAGFKHDGLVCVSAFPYDDRMRACAGLVAIVAGCGFRTGNLPTTGTGSLIDGSGGSAFAGMIDNGVITSRDTIEPDVYAAGGWLATAYAGAEITATTTWQELTSTPPTVILGTPIGTAYDAIVNGSFAKGANTFYPFGLDVNAGSVGDTFTIVFQGEIYLEAGAVTLLLTTDDEAFVDVTLGQTPTTLRASNSGSGMLQLTTPAAGWYAIDGAFSEANSGGTPFTLDEVIDGSAQPLSISDQRSDTTAASGVLVRESFFPDLVFPQVGFYQNGSIDYTDLRGQPGTELAELVEHFSARFTGQLLVDTAGEYSALVTLTPSDTNDHSRVWIDHQLVACNGWLAQTGCSFGSIILDAGWHTLSVDVSIGNANNTAAVPVSFSFGPTGGTLAAVDAAHLRPTLASDLMTIIYGSQTPVTWTPPNSATYVAPLVPDAPPNATIDYVEDSYVFTGSADGLVTTLADGSAGSETLALTTTLNETQVSNFMYTYAPDDASLAGKSIGSSWTFALDGTAQQGGGASFWGAATITASGGDLEPFSNQLVYTSQAEATPNAVRFTTARATVDLQGAVLSIAIRTAASPADFTEALPWTPVTEGAISLDANAYVQYQLTVEDDGWAYPSIQAFELDYTTL
jgi:hypothetical protein